MRRKLFRNFSRLLFRSTQDACESRSVPCAIQFRTRALWAGACGTLKYEISCSYHDVAGAASKRLFDSGVDAVEGMP
jgi:hypothetical protein